MSDTVPTIEEPLSPKLHSKEPTELSSSQPIEIQGESLETIQLLPDTNPETEYDVQETVSVIISEPETQSDSEQDEMEEFQDNNNQGLVIEIDEIEEEDIDRMFDEQSSSVDHPKAESISSLEEEQVEQDSLEQGQEQVEQVEDSIMNLVDSPPRLLQPISSPTKNTKTNKTNTTNDTHKSMEKLVKLLGISSSQIDSLTELQVSHPIFSNFIEKLQVFIYPNQDSSLNITSLRAQIETLKAEKIVFEADMEQRAHTFESQHVHMSKQIKSLESEVKTAHQDNSELQVKVKQYSLKLDAKESELKGVLESISSHKQMISTLEAEKRQLFALNLKKQEEISLQTSQMESTTQQINSLRQELNMASLELNGVQSSDAKLRSELAIYEQQLGQTKRNNDWLNQELQRKSTEFNEYRREKSDQIQSLSNQLESCNQDRNSLSSKVITLERQNKDMESKIQSLNEKYKLSQDSQSISQQQFMTEMHSQKKLNDLYELKLSESTEYVQELKTLVQDLQSQVESCSTDKQEAVSAVEKQLSDSQLCIKQLQDELSILKQHPVMPSFNGVGSEGLAMLSPSALAASQLQKSGKTFTQVYSEYSQLQQDYLKEKQESAKLKSLVDSIMEELRERAPLFESYRVDLEEAKRDIEKLVNENSRFMNERNQAVQDMSSIKSKWMISEQENKILLQETRDLSRQIQELLKQIESVRTGVSIRALEQASLQRIIHNGDEGVGMETDSDALISERLVVFRNIEELQSQNVTLRRAVRSLSHKMEELESDKTDRDIYLQEMEQAKSVIESLSEQLNIQSLKLDTFVRERDQWKKIAEARSGSASPPKDKTSSPVPSSLGLETIELQKMYQAQVQELSMYKKESNTNIKMLKEQLESIQEEKMNLSIQVARSTSQLTWQEERYNLMVGNLEIQTKEVTSLREKLSLLTSNLTRQESKMQDLSLSLQESRQNVEILKNENQQAKIERQVWKSNESRLSNERQELVKERSAAMDRLVELQYQMDDKDKALATEREKLESRYQELQKELSSTRQKLNELMDEHVSITNRHELESKESQKKMESLSINLEKTKGELTLSLSKESGLNEKLVELNSKLKSALDQLAIHENRAKSSSTRQDATPQEQVKSLELSLNQAQCEMASLQESLKLEKERTLTFQGISQANEERLAELNSTYDLYKSEMERQLQEKTTELEAIEADRQELLQRLSQTAQEITAAQDQLSSQKNEYEKQLQESKTRLDSLESLESNYNSRLDKLKADVELHANIAKESRLNYEREVIAHSSALQSLSLYKEQVVQAKSLLAETESKFKSSQNALETSTASWNVVKEELESEVLSLTRRCEEYKSQNALLHAQFESFQYSSSRLSENVLLSLSDEVELASRGVSSSQGEGQGEIQEQQVLVNTEKVIQDLKQVIRFLRREKDILQTRLDLVSQENERFTIQVNHLQKSLDETRAILDEERIQPNELGNQEKHLQLLEKIEQANLLRESNVTLRDNLESSNKKLALLESELAKTLAEMGPLKERLVLLESDLNTRQDEIQGLKQDNSRWKARTQQILEKYERIDPVEFANLKQLVESQSAELVKLNSLIQQGTVKLKEEEEKFKKIEIHARRLKTLNDQKSNEVTEKDTLITKLESDLESLKSSGSSQVELTQAQALVQKLQNEKKLLTERSNAINSKLKEKNSTLLAKLKEQEGKLSEKESLHKGELESVESRISTDIEAKWKAKFTVLSSQIEKYQKLLNENKSKLQECLTEMSRQKFVIADLNARLGENVALGQSKRSRQEDLSFTGTAVSAVTAGVGEVAGVEETQGKPIDKEQELPNPKRMRVEAEPFIPESLQHVLPIELPIDNKESIPLEDAIQEDAIQEDEVSQESLEEEEEEEEEEQEEEEESIIQEQKDQYVDQEDLEPPTLEQAQEEEEEDQDMFEGEDEEEEEVEDQEMTLVKEEEEEEQDYPIENEIKETVVPPPSNQPEIQTTTTTADQEINNFIDNTLFANVQETQETTIPLSPKEELVLETESKRSISPILPPVVPVVGPFTEPVKKISPILPPAVPSKVIIQRGVSSSITSSVIPVIPVAPIVPRVPVGESSTPVVDSSKPIQQMTPIEKNALLKKKMDLLAKKKMEVAESLTTSIVGAGSTPSPSTTLSTTIAGVASTTETSRKARLNRPPSTLNRIQSTLSSTTTPSTGSTTVEPITISRGGGRGSSRGGGIKKRGSRGKTRGNL